MFNRALKITLAFLFCLTAFPATSFAEVASKAQLSTAMDVTIKISATTSTGDEIPAYYDETSRKYYLFMFASESKQVPVTYVGIDGEEVTEVVDFTASNEVVLSNTQAGSVSVVFQQSKIPSLSITLNGTTLDEIHADKSVSHDGNSLIIDDPSGENSLTAQNVTVKGRGNSSWSEFDKKGYQIKFEKKTSVLGMDKAKKWVLIPNASDDSLVRNKIAYSLAQKIGMENTMECKYVDLWVDGDYRGNYLISEKVEIGTNRVNLQADDGILFEWDSAFAEGEDYWFENSTLGTKFGVKETVNEDPLAVQQTIQKTNDSLTEFANYLFKTPSDQLTVASLSKYIDLESFVQYYLINEYMLSSESITTSWFWYKDGASDVLHLGPVWDFDSCANFYGEPTDYYIYRNNIFDSLLKAPKIRTYIQNYYSNNIALFNNLPTLARTEAASINESANMDFVRWDIANLPGKTGYVNHASYSQAVNAAVTWLQQRCSTFEIPVLSQEMHRLYNPYTGEHFYTADTTERDTLVGIGWISEGVGWTAPTTYGKEVYRLYNKYTSDHHYTTSTEERDTLVEIGWTDEGVGWLSDQYEKTPLYRQFNPYETIGTHNYTTSFLENNTLAQIGWKAEGIAWYGL